MLSSISPLGEQARDSRWWVTTTFYVAGSVLGGAVMGLVAAVLGSVVPQHVRSSLGMPLVAVLLMVGLVLDVRARGGALPSWRRQVDERWLTEYRGWVYGLGFGVQLGFGLVTIVTSATTYAVVALAALGGDPRVGLALGCCFGLVRALPSVAMRGIDSRPALHSVFQGVERWFPRMDAVARLSLLGSSLLLAGLTMNGVMS